MSTGAGAYPPALLPAHRGWSPACWLEEVMRTLRYGLGYEWITLKETGPIWYLRDLRDVGVRATWSIWRERARRGGRA